MEKKPNAHRIVWVRWNTKDKRSVCVCVCLVFRVGLSFIDLHFSCLLSRHLDRNINRQNAKCVLNIAQSPFTTDKHSQCTKKRRRRQQQQRRLHSMSVIKQCNMLHSYICNKNTHHTPISIQSIQPSMSVIVSLSLCNSYNVRCTLYVCVCVSLSA